MFKALVICGALFAAPVLAQEESFTLEAPSAFQDSGFLRYLLPRFSLKTDIKIQLVEEGALARFGVEGTPVFREGAQVWRFAAGGSTAAERFETWLLSETGKRRIEGFAPNGSAVFQARIEKAAVAKLKPLKGDAALGARVSLEKCGRCHVVHESNRMKAIGSTPSFALMRGFEDWRRRYEAFYLLNPHPAFTQVFEVTDPFAAHLPSPIAPIEVTLNEIAAIVAYVASLQPVDLGSPIQSQLSRRFDR